MIEIGRRPACCRVTLDTVCGDGDMVGVHTVGNGAVVATVAGTDHISMVDPSHRFPLRIAMAILAHIVGLHMFGVLTRQRRYTVTT